MPINTLERFVLTDEVIRHLARAAADIKIIFKGRNQDIEWVYREGQIYIVQSRPFISGPSTLVAPKIADGVPKKAKLSLNK